MPQCQPPGPVGAYMAAVLGDYAGTAPESCYYGTRSKSAIGASTQPSSDLHEECDDSSDDEAPDLVSTSDDDSDAESVDYEVGESADLSAEVPVGAPRRYPTLPAVTYARPGILGGDLPPYALLDLMDYSEGANRVVLFDVGYSPAP